MIIKNIFTNKKIIWLILRFSTIFFDSTLKKYLYLEIYIYVYEMISLFSIIILKIKKRN